MRVLFLKNFILETIRNKNRNLFKKEKEEFREIIIFFVNIC
jgi:hypothetical protein